VKKVTNNQIKPDGTFSYKIAEGRITEYMILKNTREIKQQAQYPKKRAES